MICSICKNNIGSKCGTCSKFHKEDIFICSNCDNLRDRSKAIINDLSQTLNNILTKSILLVICLPVCVNLTNLYWIHKVSCYK